MTSLHTPGAWIAVGAWIEHEDDAVADIANFEPSSMGQAHLRRSGEEIHANARLCAAAPTMLGVLQDLQESASYWSEYDVPIGIVERINAAISKATGGAA